MNKTVASTSFYTQAILKSSTGKWYMLINQQAMQSNHKAVRNTNYLSRKFYHIKGKSSLREVCLPICFLPFDISFYNFNIPPARKIVKVGSIIKTYKNIRKLECVPQPDVTEHYFLMFFLRLSWTKLPTGLSNSEQVKRVDTSSLKLLSILRCHW